MDQLNEDLQMLDELIRTAYSLISPLDVHHNLKWLKSQSLIRQVVVSHFSLNPAL